MPLPDLRGEEEPVAQDVVRDVAEVGLVPPETADRSEQQIEVEGHEADAGDLARVKPVLVEVVRDVRCNLDDWKRTAGEVGGMHEHREVVHGFGHGGLEFLGERGLSRAVQDQGGELKERLPVTRLAEAPSPADKVEAARPAVLLEEGGEGGLDGVTCEGGEPLGDGQRGGPRVSPDCPG